MGLIKKLIRGLKGKISYFFGVIIHGDSKKRRKKQYQQPDVVPRSWGKPGEKRTGKQYADSLPRITYKRRVPGLKTVNRIGAGIWLFLNFVFSQFLLANIGNQAQWTFVFFLGNCYFIAKYLWGSRDESKK